MKKIKVVLLVMILELSFASPICAKGAELNNLSSDVEYVSNENTKYVPENCNSDIIKMQDIHELALQEEKCIVKNGHYEIVEEKSIDISSDDMQKYKECIYNINQIIDLGVAYIDKNSRVQTISQGETKEIIYNRDKKIRSGELVGNNEFDASTNFGQTDTVKSARAAALPTLHAYSIASSNKAELQKYWETMVVFSPDTAYANAVGWWIGKVQSGGAWDYKSVSGYAPYNRRWNAVQKNISVVRTSEWFGNYNYGFTGKLLFSENILLLGGDGVSLIFNHQIDDQADKDAIRTGYGES